MRGAISLSSSSHLPAIVGSDGTKPVTLPPGRARLATKPLPTESATFAKMMGTVRVCCSNAAVVCVVCERMRSGCSAIQFLRKSLQRLGIRRPPSGHQFGCCGPPASRAAGASPGTPRRRPLHYGRSWHTTSTRRCVAAGRLRARRRGQAAAAPPSSAMSTTAAQLIKLHSLPCSTRPIAGYRIARGGIETDFTTRHRWLFRLMSEELGSKASGPEASQLVRTYDRKPLKADMISLRVLAPASRKLPGSH